MYVSDNCFSIAKSRNWIMLNPGILGLKIWRDPRIRDPRIAVPNPKDCMGQCW